MLVMKHECECLEIWDELNCTKLYSFKTENWYYLSVPDDDVLNEQNNETFNLQWTNSKMMMTIK